jgi:hypothetical protein
MQVLQQVNTGRTMHLGYRKSDIRLRIPAKADEFSYSAFIIQVGESFRLEFPFYFNTGIFIQIIVRTEIILIQEEVYLFTPLAAKMMFIQ